MSAPDTREPDEHLIRAALDARAATAVIEPEPWARFEKTRRSRSASVGLGLRGHGPLLAVSAAAAALILVLALLVGTGVDNSSPVGTRGGDRSPSTTAPAGPVATEPAAPVGTEVPVGPPASVPPAADLAGIDLSNATYPKSVCPYADGLPGGSTFTLHDGVAGYEPNGGVDQVRDPARTHGVWLEQAVHGDVDGDGRAEVVLRLYCFVAATEAAARAVVVLGAEDGRPVVLASRAESGADARLRAVDPSDPRGDIRVETANLEEQARDVTIRDGRVIVTWSQTGPPASYLGDYRTRVSYRLTGGALTVESATDRQTVTPSARRPEAYYAIRRSPIRSMTVPLAPGAAVHPFADLLATRGPLRDAVLVDGRARLVTANGEDKGDTVSVEDVFYAASDWTPDPEGGPVPDREAALVSLRCLCAGADQRMVTVVRLVDGRPTVTDVIEGPAPHVAGNIVPGGPNSVTVFWIRTGGAAEPVSYRWDGSHFAPV